MDKLSRQVKTLEVNLHNLIVRQNELNAKQDVYNRQVASNMLALGHKVFPEKFATVSLCGKEVVKGL